MEQTIAARVHEQSLGLRGGVVQQQERLGLGGMLRHVEEDAQAAVVTAVDRGQVDVDEGDAVPQTLLRSGAHLARGDGVDHTGQGDQGPRAPVVPADVHPWKKRSSGAGVT